MSTKLPKISAYIPHDLYKCLQKDQRKTGMSMSQAVIAALANHYNLEETVGKGVRGRTAPSGRCAFSSSKPTPMKGINSVS